MLQNRFKISYFAAGLLAGQLLVFFTFLLVDFEVFAPHKMKFSVEAYRPISSTPNFTFRCRGGVQHTRHQLRNYKFYESCGYKCPCVSLVRFV